MVPGASRWSSGPRPDRKGGGGGGLSVNHIGGRREEAPACAEREGKRWGGGMEEKKEG